MRPSRRYQPKREGSPPFKNDQLKLKQIYEASNFLKKHTFTARRVDPNPLNVPPSDLYGHYLNNLDPLSSGKPKQELFKIRKSLSHKKKFVQSVNVSKERIHSQYFVNYHEEGKKLHKEGKFQEALKLFLKGVEQSSAVPDNLYSAALCSLSLQKYKDAYDSLAKLIREHPVFNKKSAYLFASVAAKHIDNLQAAVQLCEEGITRYPGYYELILYKAGLMEQMQDFMKAHACYEQALQLKKNTPEVLLSNAKCLLKVNMLTNCLSNLSSALYASADAQLTVTILEIRLKVYLLLDMLKEAKKDHSRLEQLNPSSPYNAYFKGVMCLKEEKRKEAALCFERCLKAEQDRELMGLALVELSKMKIQERDFYSARYQISRSEFLELSSDQIQKYLLFTDGVVFLMKRKIGEGVAKLELMRDKYPLGDYFQSMYYLYLAFGHFMLNRHSEAILDYAEHLRHSPQDPSSTYNELIAQGVVQVKQGNFERGLQFFIEAQACVDKVEPYLYRAMSYIELVKTRQIDELAVLEHVFLALKELDKAYDLHENNSNMLYLRSLIYLYLGKSNEALQDIVKAIAKSEENVPKYFFFRALANSSQGNRKQALNDLNICLNLDENYANAYLERAKILFSDETTQAQAELEKLKRCSPETDIKLHECCLFYIAQSYEQAEQCLLEVGPCAMRDSLAIHLALKTGKVESARELMPVPTDQAICDIIKGNYVGDEPSFERPQKQGDPEGVFTAAQFYNYIGIKHLHNNMVEEAVNDFTLALKERNLSDLEEGVIQENESEDQHGLQLETHFEEANLLKFNLLVAYLKNKELRMAYEVLVRDILPSRYSFLSSEPVNQFSRLLLSALRWKGEEPEDKQQFTLELYRTVFSSSADYLRVELPCFILRTKLCYLTPYYKDVYRIYQPRIYPQAILAMMGIHEVENRPQPPWVRRNEQQDLVFTDEVVNIDLEFKTTQNDEEQEDENEEQEEENEEQGSQQEYQEDEESKESFDPRQFRDNMKLGDELQKRLERIIEKRQ